MTVQELIQRGYGGYAGWSDEAATADFLATGGAGKRTSTGSDPGSNLFANFTSTLQQSIDDYINGLMDEAQGDREYLIRKLDAQHELALGQGDGASAQFLEKVADQLEQKIGRIPFDYERYSSRELEDYAKGESRLESATERALKRLKEDEAYLKQGLDVQALAERRAQDASLNARGLVSAPRNQAQGLAGAEVGRLEDDISRREQALASSIGRSQEDLLLSRQQGLEDLALSRDRNLQDLTTQARRAAINQNLSTDWGKEDADRALEKRKKALEAQKQSMQLPALTGAFAEVFG